METLAQTLFSMIGSGNRSEVERLVRLSSPGYLGYQQRLVAKDTSLDFERSNSKRLVFTVSVLHQDPVEAGGYTTHTVVCTPSRTEGLGIRITGSNRHGAKEHLADAYRQWLTETTSTED